MIYIDTNVLYSYLFETPMSENAESVLELPEKVTSRVAINEAVYVVFRRLARDKGITNVYEAKKFVKLKEGQDLLERAYSTVMELVKLSGITVVEEEDDFEILKDISSEYGLLPNDAIIVATCVKHGITEIATFDSDFDNVPFLKIVRG